MAAPRPAKMAKESATISMVIGPWKHFIHEQFSPVVRYSGYPWRLKIVNSNRRSDREAFLLCDKSTEAEVWQCRATIRSSSLPSGRAVGCFDNWYDRNKQCSIGKGDFPGGTRLEVEITTDHDGDTSCRNYHSLDPMAVRDGALLVGDKTVYVNKEWLASQSPFFHHQFFGDSNEREMDQIPIGDVEYEELANMIRLLCRFSTASLTDQNVNRVMELAQRYGLKMIEDRVVNYLFSYSALPFIQKLLIVDKYKMEDELKKTLIYGCGYSQVQLMMLPRTPEFKMLSPETIGVMVMIIAMSDPAFFYSS